MRWQVHGGRRPQILSSTRTTTKLILSLLFIFLIFQINLIFIYERTIFHNKKQPPRLNQDAALHNKPKRCALLFFGLLKYFEEIALPAIQENILKNNAHCDIFLHTYKLDAIPVNPRNHETNTQIYTNVTEAFLLTPHVIMEDIESFYRERNSFLESTRVHYHQKWGDCCQAHDNMIKQWHSIKGVWDLMREYELEQNDGNTEDNYYTHVGFFRSDVYQVTPIEDILLLQSQFHHDAVVPGWGSYNGVNDRLFYGSYENARRWADRFTFANIFESRYMTPFDPKKPETMFTGYHSETFLGSLFKHYQINKEEDKDICMWRIRSGKTLQISDCSQRYLHLRYSKDMKIDYSNPHVVIQV